MSPAKVRVLDLFAGAGGLTQGFVMADVPHESVGAVEMDLSAAATFAQNHPGPVYAGSIEDWLSEGEVPEADIVVGGPPCQGFSQLGKKDHTDDRNGLWRQYAETIRLAKPQYFLMENVPRFLHSPERELMELATSSGGPLSDYAFHAVVLNAADFGAPQTRKRAIVIGHHKDCPYPGLPPRRYLPADYETVHKAIGTLPYEIEAIDLPTERISFAGKHLPGPFTTEQLHLTRRYTSLSLNRFEHIPPGGNRFDLPEDLQARCWQRHKTGSGDVMGRLHWHRPSVTIRTEFFKPEKGRYLHPTSNRAISHLEAARLQGFADDYRWVGSKVSIARQVGNAVPVPLAAALAGHVAAHLGVAGSDNSTTATPTLPLAV